MLTRRIFLPATRRDDLKPEQWQLPLAVALTDLPLGTRLGGGAHVHERAGRFEPGWPPPAPDG